MRNSARGGLIAAAVGVGLALVVRQATSEPGRRPVRDEPSRDEAAMVAPLVALDASGAARRSRAAAGLIMRGARPAVRGDDLAARIDGKLVELGRGEQLARLRPYFPATPRGAQLAALATLGDDIADATEAGIFARAELLPDLIADREGAAAAVRHALLAMPPGDGELGGAKELLVNFISGHATLDPQTITGILDAYLVVEQPKSAAGSHAAYRRQVALERSRATRPTIDAGMWPASLPPAF